MRRSLSSLLAAAAMLLALAAPGAVSAASASTHRAAALPTVSGSFGQTPKITFPSGEKAPKSLEKKVLHQGTGPVTRKGDLLVANYLGQIWGGKVFDSSFSRHQLSGFGIGIGEVIKGWDRTLVGVPSGSRVLLVIPPADGYGKSGQSAAGITGTDTLVFVVDVVASYNHTVEAETNAKVLRRSVGGVTISGALGAPPTIEVARRAAKPTSTKTTILARGHGKAITTGLVVVQFIVTNWSSAVQESTWKTGTPYAINVDLASNPTIFDSLKGVPVGSRVLIEIPAQSGSGPYALVLDAVAQPRDPQH